MIGFFQTILIDRTNSRRWVPTVINVTSPIPGIQSHTFFTLTIALNHQIGYAFAPTYSSLFKSSISAHSTSNHTINKVFSKVSPVIRLNRISQIFQPHQLSNYIIEPITYPIWLRIRPFSSSFKCTYINIVYIKSIYFIKYRQQHRGTFNLANLIL